MRTGLAGHTVLIVEDEPLIAIDIVQAFKQVGAVALLARALSEARKLVERSDLSAAVLDFGLGDGDAEQLCHRLTERHVPFVLHSGYSHHGEACGKGIRIPKPAGPEALVRAVEGALHTERRFMVTQTMARQHNRILSALSNKDLAILQPHLHPVPLKLRERLQSANRRVTDVYFLESGLGSVVAIGRGDRRQAEVAVIGREGMTGLPVVHGVDRSPCDVFMQIEGQGQRISADNLRTCMDKSITLFRTLLRFAHVFAVQSSYTALANSQGKLEERLARWLLMAHDRIEGDQLLLTHEFLALMLGTRRAGVTTAIGHYEEKGLIETARGAITLLDRQGLEECAKGLYGEPEAEFERLFGASR